MAVPGEFPAPIRRPERRIGIRLAAFGVAAIYLLVLGLVVLLPQPVQDVADLEAQGTFGLGWLADGLRNILLFVPLGAGVRLATGSSLRALALSAVLAIVFELLQTFIPGRFSSPVDIVTNAIGAWLGAWIMGHRVRLLAPPPRQAARLAWTATLMAASIWILGTLALAPATPDTRYFGGHTPQLAHLAHYQGQILQARVGDSPISAAGLVDDQAALKRSLQSEKSIRIRFRRGPAPARLAPLVTLHDDLQREILLVGLEGDDLVLRRWVHGAAWGLENPAHRWPAALAPNRVGDVAELDLGLEQGRSHARIDGRALADHAWSPARIWALVLPRDIASEASARNFDAVCIAALTLPVAFYARHAIVGFPGLAALAALLIVLPAVLGCAAISVREWLTFGGTVALGLWLGGRAIDPDSSERGAE